ncbi:hypothetical protein [Moritella sp. F3]|uniref:hypothetical protein n=1 Tax=Moritella sp. F3 TaxID=2718882 RepID=UPI0018E14E93|nr:hypothetical protein [Moritella sp. F3]GIC75997.1 hypothetical protein FMO001_07240 [Moritella sp. F1]GIC81536.1 hypothetical protein FMO003_18170 [Moritella sp. F3]
MFNSKLEFQQFYDNAGDVSLLCNKKSLAKLISLDLHEIVELTLEKRPKLIRKWKDILPLCQLALLLGNNRIINSLLITFPKVMLDESITKEWSEELASSILDLSLSELHEFTFTNFDNDDTSPLIFTVNALNGAQKEDDATELVYHLNNKLTLNSKVKHRHILCDFLARTSLNKEQLSKLISGRTKRQFTHVTFSSYFFDFTNKSLLAYIKCLYDIYKLEEINVLHTEIHKMLREEDLDYSTLGEFMLKKLIEATLLAIDHSEI